MVWCYPKFQPAILTGLPVGTVLVLQICYCLLQVFFEVPLSPFPL